MIPLRIFGANRVMKAPSTHPDVRDLHVHYLEGVYVSRWEPTPEELAILNDGGSVELQVLGCQPCVSLAAVPRAGDSDAG